MIEIAKQVIDFYIKSGRKPKTGEIKIENKDLLTQRGCLFVTIYYKGEVRGSAGNIKEISENLYEEIVENTIAAISKDSRFEPISPKIGMEAKIRIDYITKRSLLKKKSLKDVDPATSGVIAIRADYEKMAVILPNINPKLINGEDFKSVLGEKLQDSNFQEKNYIIYEIKTEVKTSF